jgi:hypothetical protein
MRLRFRASLIHLALSFLFFSTVVGIALLIWYPGLYFTAMGISKILFIVAGVDIILGPLLTLIIFNPAKSSLKFDLAVIALLQLAALGYGVSTVFAGRPLFVVYNLDRFTVVSGMDIPADELARAGKLAVPLTGPQIIGARLPKDREEQSRILFSAVNGGADLPQMPMFYVPYATVSEDVKAKMLTTEMLLAHQPALKVNQAQGLIAATLADRGLKPADIGFIPLRAKAQDLTVMVRRTDASIIKILPIDPWGS